MACRSFAIDAEGHSKRVKEYEDERREYKEAVYFVTSVLF